MALHQALVKSKWAQRDAVAHNIQAFAERLERQEAKRVRRSEPDSDDDQQTQPQDVPELSLDQVIQALEEEEHALQADCDALAANITSLKKSMTK